MTPPYHIGHRIKQVMWEKRIPAVQLAERICVCRTHIYKIYEKDTIDTHLLMRISLALSHNFFAEIASYISENLADTLNS